MRDLRVLMLAARFPPEYGGAAHQALHLCHKLRQCGVSVSVITGYRGPRVMSEWVEGIPVTRLPVPHRLGLGVLPFYVRLLRLLIVRRHEYDLIHAHVLHHHAYVGFLVGRLLRKPAIVKIALLGYDDPASLRYRRMGSIQLWLMRYARMLVVTTQEMAEAVTAFGWPAQRMARIPNGVDIERFRPVTDAVRDALRARLGIPSDALVVTYLGVIDQRKGIHTLARAWACVKQAQPQALLLLVGPCSKGEDQGIDEGYVKEIEAALGGSDVKPRIRFTGRVSDPEAWLQASDIFVFPSEGEGMPNALLEAMACGLPFVATRLGCAVEMAPLEGQPFLVPVEDPDALAKAIITLARDADARQRLGLVVRQTVETRFSLDAIADSYLDLYQKLLGCGNHHVAGRKRR